MMPHAYLDSDYWCVRCAKRCVVEHGQHESSAELVESHSCLSCGRVWNNRPERRALSLAESPARVLWAIPEQYVEIRTRHLDRPEFLSDQPGLREIVEEWVDAG